MPRGSYKRRVDVNQQILVELIRKAGASVFITSDLGRGFPDIVVGLNGKTVLVEIKDGLKPPSAQKLTEPEQKFFNEWKGAAAIIKNEEEALKLVYDMRVA